MNKLSPLAPAPRLKLTRAFFWLFSLVWTLSASALDPTYLDEMPSVEQVKADIQGKDDLDTRARQVGALLMLRRVVEDMAGGRRYQNQLTPDEIRIRDAYGEEGFRLKNETLATLESTATGVNSPKAKWLDDQWDYENDPKQKRLILARYFSDDFLRQLGAEISAMDRKVAQSQAQMREDRGIRETSWEGMSAEEKTGVTLFVLFCFGLIALWLHRESRTFGLSPKNPLELRSGYRKFDLHTFTGTVSRYKSGKSSETTSTTTRYSDGSQETRHSSKSYFWEAFDLVDGNQVIPLFIYDSHTGLADGHQATSLQAMKKKKDKGHYIAFIDHTTGKTWPVKHSIHKFFKPSRFILLPLAFLIIVLDISFEDSIPFMSNAPEMRILLVLVWLLPVWIIFSRILSNRRQKRFFKKDTNRIVEAVALPGNHA